MRSGVFAWERILPNVDDVGERSGGLKIARFVLLKNSQRYVIATLSVMRKALITEKSTWFTPSWRRLEKRVGKKRRLNDSCWALTRLNTDVSNEASTWCGSRFSGPPI